MTIESGALEQAYVKADSSFGVLTSPASTDGIRHLELTLQDTLNREKSPQKRGTPDHATSLSRRRTAAFNLGGAFWEPSGTLGTASYLAAMLKSAFGTQTSPGLSTTIDGSSSTPTTTGSNLASAGSLAIGDQVVVTRADGSREVTRIKTVAASTPSAVTYDALSSPSAHAGVVVSGVNFKFASLLTQTLSIFLYHTGGGFKQAVSGALVDKVEFTLDGTKEASVKMSGWAKALTRSGITQPASHTTVGSPVSGMVGNFYLDGSAFLINQLTVALTNNEDPRNNELGTSTASGHMRGAGRRVVEASCSFYLEDTTLLANAEAVTRNVIRAIVGSTNGSMVGLVLPSVEWKIPDVPGSDGPKILTASGEAYAGTSGNDALFAGEH